MIFKESEVQRIRNLLWQHARDRGEPTSITDAIRFTLENAEPVGRLIILPADPEAGRAAQAGNPKLFLWVTPFRRTPDPSNPA